MLGKNKITPPHSFDQAPSDTLKVTSIFYTLQGEGPFAGRPAVFLRLAHCNLACSFCDTSFDQGQVLTFDEVLAQIAQKRRDFYTSRGLLLPPQSTSNLLVITGGEPLLQRNITKFVHMARDAGYEVQIETNGTVYRYLHIAARIVCSPKVNEKTGQYIRPNKKLLELVDDMKFLISADRRGYQDIPEFAVSWRDYLPDQRTLIVSPINEYLRAPDESPDGKSSFWDEGLIDKERTRANYELAAQVALKYAARLSLQLHLLTGLP
jgi:7-carboxy-7-deazaguanine synthase